MKIYTKKGDGGKTFKGLAKSDDLIEALGAVDEANCWIGMCGESVGDKKIDTELIKIQKNLLVIGARLAGSKKSISKGETKRLEKLIDVLNKDLPKITNFILPKGVFQVTRAVVRRAERRIVGLGIEDKEILKYVNRLSDALFVIGRWVSKKRGMKEEVWK